MHIMHNLVSLIYAKELKIYLAQNCTSDLCNNAFSSGFRP